MSNWRSTRDYRLWRVAIIRRDKVCQICESRQSRHAHHIESGAYNPELRYVTDNGVCLCSGCHIQYHTNFNRSYRIKTTRYNFENFVSLMNYTKKLFGNNI